jgi:hypothetical protein
MRTSFLKHFLAILALGAVHLSGAGVVQAGEAAALKVSKKLTLGIASAKDELASRVHTLKEAGNLLGKVPLFRGVSVIDENERQQNASALKSGASESKENRRSTLNAVYGGLQISLQENLSLIYAPGRLSGNNLNSESQGLYLLANRGGLANWFMGLESRSYGSAADTRRTANTAQFGVIMDLD